MVSDIQAATPAGDDFGKWTRPALAQLLRGIRFDVVYERGEGDYLIHRDGAGQEHRVLDMLGGYGASLLGHNHPELVARVREGLDDGWAANAQGSVRARAGRLARVLAERVAREAGRTFVVTFGNSGAEAVEAALKHAALEHSTRGERAARRVDEQVVGLRLSTRSGQLQLDEEVLARAAARFQVPRIDGLEELVGHVLRHNAAVLGRSPIFLALEGAFHGKTIGALQLTHAPQLRLPWSGLGPKTVFLPLDDEDELEAAVTEASECLLEFGADPGCGLELVERPWSHVAAAFVEPIQGEGGIREVPARYLETLRSAADRAGFPIVFDEIQTGLGRTGTFLASSLSGIAGDYYLLSKSLGGGLVKLSALLVDQARYVAGFDYLHTSTFADDDLSSHVALGVLELLERDDEALVRRCAEQGTRLKRRLDDLRRRHPEIIRDVRGRGLMLGLELIPQTDSPSAVLRAISEQDRLTFVVCGHLLHESGVRMAPTFSAPNTLRLEPSAYVSDADIDRTCAALERVVSIIEDADAHRLLGFLAEESDPDAVSTRVTDRPRGGSSARTADASVALIGHFLAPEDVLAWDPRLAPFSPAACDRLLRRTEPILEPVIVHQQTVRSVDDVRVTLNVVGIPVTAAQLLERFRRGENSENLELVREALRVARRGGCSVAGFAGATSIITNSCLDLHADDLCLTTGNSLTAAAAMEALVQAVLAGGADPDSTAVGVIGAFGNVGRALAELGAEIFAEIVLIGRPGAARRLQRVADTIYGRAIQCLADDRRAGGVAASIASTRTVTRLLAAGATAPTPEDLTALASELGPRQPVRVETALDGAAGCDAVITATNAPMPILAARHLGARTRVVCDVALPRDVDPALPHDRPDVLVLKGGQVRLPLGQQVDLPGMRSPDGHIVACLAETILLGMAGVRDHFSRGPVTAQRAVAARRLAATHGFSVSMVRDHGALGPP